MSKPAIFLDRDGVITVEIGKICPINEVTIYPDVNKAIARIHELGYLAIVLTNQSGVARGVFSESELCCLNDDIKEITGVDAIYYCPHHIDGIISKYVVECECRKPKIGMIKNACRDFEIDLSQSWMIGDRIADIMLGVNAGINTCLVKTGYGSSEIEALEIADVVCDDLQCFVKLLSEKDN